MRYLVTAMVRAGKERELLRAVETGALGAGSVAGGEYLRCVTEARILEGGRTKWEEVCFCDTPLAEERPFWEEYFEIVRVQDAHDRGRCRDVSGSEPWACGECDCSAQLEAKLVRRGQPLLAVLRAAILPETKLPTRGSRAGE